jgi:hypothetical protein
MKVSEINESARLEWLDRKRLILSFDYRNRFYGECTLVVHLARNDLYLRLEPTSIRMDTHELNRGDDSTLLKVSTNFLQRVLVRYPNLGNGNSPIPTRNSLRKVQNWFVTLLRRTRYALRSLAGVEDS